MTDPPRIAIAAALALVLIMSAPARAAGNM